MIIFCEYSMDLNRCKVLSLHIATDCACRLCYPRFLFSYLCFVYTSAHLWNGRAEIWGGVPSAAPRLEPRPGSEATGGGGRGAGGGAGAASPVARRQDGHNGVWELGQEGAGIRAPRWPQDQVSASASRGRPLRAPDFQRRSPCSAFTRRPRDAPRPQNPGGFPSHGVRPKLGAAGREHLTTRHGLGCVGRPLAAAPAPRPHRGAAQRPGAQIQAALQHGLRPARPVADPRPRLHLRPAPPHAADLVRPRAQPPGAGAHDRARPRLHPRLLHLRPPTPGGTQPHSRTGQVLPGASGGRDISQGASAHHRLQKLGHPHGAAHPRSGHLHSALAPGPARHRESLGPNLLHLRPQRSGQCLRGPQQDPRSVRLPRGEPWGLQVSGPSVHDAGADCTPQRQQPESRARSLQCGPGPEAWRLELRDPALGLSGPDAARRAQQGRLTRAVPQTSA